MTRTQERKESCHRTAEQMQDDKRHNADTFASCFAKPMKITAVTKYGGSAKENRDGFKLNLEADLSDAQVKEAAAIGLASIAYRAGANVINKALKVDSNSGSEYSEDGATAIQEALSEWAISDDAPLKGGFDLAVDVERHVHGASTTVKMEDERDAYARRNGDQAGLKELADKVGYSGDLGNGKREDAPVPFLRAIYSYAEAQRKAKVNAL